MTAAVTSAMTTTDDRSTGRIGELTAHSYGKTGLRLAKIERDGDVHTFHDLTIRIWLTGDFSAAYLTGDNSTTLPTDTMRATAYAFAADMPLGETEDYLSAVCQRLLTAAPAATAAHAEAVVHRWDRIVCAGTPAPTAFRRGSGDGTASVTVPRTGSPVITSGVTDLMVAKTAHSEYWGFLQDEYTVLAETSDRILATSVEATWGWRRPPASYLAARELACTTIEQAFAEHHSLAVQHTLFAVGEAVLRAVPEISEIRLRMPNRHHVPVDLTPFGRPTGDVCVVLDRPYGVIEGTVGRADGDRDHTAVE